MIYQWIEIWDTSQKRGKQFMNNYSTIRKITVKKPTNRINNDPEIFQDKIDENFHGFGFLFAYVDDLLIITKGDWSGHLEKIEPTLNTLGDTNLKCYINKTFLRKTEPKYGGLWVRDVWAIQLYLTTTLT